MGVFSTKPREVSHGSAGGITEPVGDNKTAQDAVTGREDSESNGEPTLQEDPDRPTEDAQTGVQEVEAVTLSWSKKSLIAVFAKYVTTCP
jgi:hypothetical protein